MSNNLHQLLTHPSKSSLLKALDLRGSEESFLRAARQELEQAITTGFRFARKQERDKKSGIEVPLPRYALQGSYVYRTLISPAYPPKQQVDIDLGIYLPFTALEDGNRPLANVKKFFGIIEQLLEEHIRDTRRNWILQTGKKTCIRVELNEKTHIDFPLYGVPDSEMSRVVENRIQITASEEKGVILAADDWIDDIDPTVIHLAHRDDGWIPSDPLVIREWVKNACANKGFEIRPLCRYLKAWRDEKWKDGGGPSSIFILAHTINSFERSTNRYCSLLRNVIDALPTVFGRPLLIPCPTPDDPNATEDLCSDQRISQEEKQEFLIAFTNLQQRYQNALDEDNPVVANEILIELFGERLPYDPGRITRSTPPPPDKPRDVVRRAAPIVAPLRSTDRSMAG